MLGKGVTLWSMRWQLEQTSAMSSSRVIVFRTLNLEIGTV